MDRLISRIEMFVFAIWGLVTISSAILCFVWVHASPGAKIVVWRRFIDTPCERRRALTAEETSCLARGHETNGQHDFDDAESDVEAIAGGATRSNEQGCIRIGGGMEPTYCTSQSLD